MTAACPGCGVAGSADTPASDHCGSCPPWTCDGCGCATSMAAPCKCWVDVRSLALADIKALFALGDLSIEATR